MRRLLVTGGAGFIGANFIRYWMRHHPGDRLLVLDAFTYASTELNLSALDSRVNFRLVRGDIRDESTVEKVMTDEHIDIVINFAAESHVDRSIVGPDIFVDTNIRGTHVLLKVARKLWLESDKTPANPRFHQVSTDEVYGSLGPADPAFSERTPYAPNSPYAATKASADHLVRAYYRTYGLPITISNCSNNYGPYQYPEKLIPLTLVNALTGRPIPIYGNGSNIRDWLYVENHCRGIELVLKRGRLGETYNVGGGVESTNIDLAKLICRTLDELFEDSSLVERFPRSPAASGRKFETLIEFVKDRSGHDFRYALDITKIRAELDYVPTDSLKEGVRKTADWFLENELWWRRVLEQTNYQEWVRRQYSAAQ